MDALGSFILLLGAACLLFGIVLIVYPIQALGFSRRFDGVLVIVAALALVILGQQLSPKLKQKAAERTARSALVSNTAHATPTQKPLTRAEALHNIRIDGFRWEKGGFGSVMIATFVVYNDNRFPIKDVTVKCTHSADSGTIIDSNTRTIYERIDASGYYSVVDMNMGFLHSATKSSACRAVNFSRL